VDLYFPHERLSSVALFFWRPSSFCIKMVLKYELSMCLVFFKLFMLLAENIIFRAEL